MQIIKLENTDISGWDFPAIREELQNRLDYYSGLVYTDETIGEAKKDRTTLNKVKKVIDDARKAYKARCLAPYDALEPDMKSLVDMVEKQKNLIDDTVKEYEARQKAAKEQEIKNYYVRKAAVFGDLAERLYPVILDSKWLNASCPRSRYEEEIISAVASASSDLEVIRAWNSPFVETLTDLYCQTLSMDRVREKKLELEAAAEKANLSNPVQAPDAPDFRSPQSESADHPAEQGNGSILIRITASQNQLNQITDFMRAIGVVYELV